MIILRLLLLIVCSSANSGLKSIDLPWEQVPFYFNSYPGVAEECEKDPRCSLKPHLHKNVCWGYEEDCDLNPRSYSHPICDGDSLGWAKTKDEQIATFYSQADFGYVRNFRKSIKPVCSPFKGTNEADSSSLECSENLTFCRGRNIVIDFRDLPKRKSPVMYDTDVLREGQIQGHCSLDKELLKKNLEFMGSLQSWGPEIQHFSELPQPINKNRSATCDRVVTRPTIIMKIDATVNMYHHFCDFLNLYATLHVNATPDNADAFGRNNQVLIWRTFPYQSSFAATFKAFTKNPILDLKSFSGKKVCFRNVIFPLLPRMIFGLFYNTPLIWGCRNSGLFQAFSKFVLHRLRIETREAPDAKKIKVTFLSRKTLYRNVLNEEELLEGLRHNPELDVRNVSFTHKTPFLQQLQVIADTDILIGMHGAGLTHLMFLPDWAVVFELYNCEDPNCYADLTRLRGLKYLTWRNTSKLSYTDIKKDLESSYFHKHANYRFDRKEFLEIVAEGVFHVKEKSKEFNTHDEL